MEESFEISGEYIQLNKLLKATGICGTGGQARMLIEDRLVSVDGETETRIRRKVKPGMVVEFDNYTIRVK